MHACIKSRADGHWSIVTFACIQVCLLAVWSKPVKPCTTFIIMESLSSLVVAQADVQHVSVAPLATCMEWHVQADTQHQDQGGSLASGQKANVLQALQSHMKASTVQML